MAEGDINQKRKGDAAGTLLCAARDLLDEAGPDHVTIRAIARRAGVSHAAPANHFADRKALLTALATQDYIELAQRLERTTAGMSPGTPARARTMADAVLDYARRYPNRYRLLWRADQLDLTDPQLESAMERLYAHLLATTGQDVGGAGEASTSRSLALWSLVHGYVSLMIDNLFTAQPDETTGAPRLHAMIDLLFRGAPDIRRVVM